MGRSKNFNKKEHNQQSRRKIFILIWSLIPLLVVTLFNHLIVNPLKQFIFYFHFVVKLCVAHQIFRCAVFPVCRQVRY